MKTLKSLVSIVLPVFNSEKYLEECLLSLFAQTYKNIEIIALDDFSKDRSLKILKKYKKNEPRLRIYKNIKRYGLTVTLNRGVKRAKGEYLAFMLAKDIISPYKIKNQVEFLIKNPKIAGVGVQSRLIDKKGKKGQGNTYPLDHGSIFKTLLPAHSILPESVLIDLKRLPKDLIKFTDRTYPLVFTDLLMKITQYSELANLDKHLYFSRKTFEQNTRLSLSLVKLWLKSIALYDYRPPLISLFSSLLKPAR